MDELSGDAGREHRFKRLYVDVYADVLRFVQRRVGGDSDPEDVVAEVFLAVWRRVDDVPGRGGENYDDDANHDSVRAWVFGVARNLLLNNRRGMRRRQALGVRLAHAEHVRAAAAGPDGVGSGAVDVALLIDLERAWRELSDVHQETLALAAFEGLDSTDAGVVVGITATAFRLRLSRARKALRSALGAEHVLDTRGSRLPDQGIAERL